MESEHIGLIEIRVNLHLVHDWFDFAAGEKIDHHWNCAIADSDALSKPLLYELLHTPPDNVEGW